MAIEPDAIEQRWDRHKHFPHHVTETARALSLAGYTSSQVAREIKNLHNYDIDPRTIRYWRSDFPKLSDEEQAAQSQLNREVALVATRQVLDDLEHRPDTIKTSEKMVIAGIAQSKEHERLQRTGNPQSNITIPIQIVVSQAPPDPSE